MSQGILVLKKKKKNNKKKTILQSTVKRKKWKTKTKKRLEYNIKERTEMEIARSTRATKKQDQMETLCCKFRVVEPTGNTKHRKITARLHKFVCFVPKGW